MESGPPSAPSSGNSDRHDASSVRGSGALLTAADIASFRVHPDGTIIDVNDAFIALTGYSRSELLGTPLSTVVADDAPSLQSLVGDSDESDCDSAGVSDGDGDAVGDGDGDAVSDGNGDDAGLSDGDDDGTRLVSTTLSIQTKAETLLSADVHLEQFETDGDESHIVGIINRRPSATESVSDSDLTYGRTFQALADALPDGIIVLDTNSDIQYANPAIERILGYTPDELVGSSKVTIIPPRLRQAHLDALQRYLETGERNLNWTYVELPGQHKAGREVPLGVSLNDFVYDGDRYFVGLFRDISPRKEAEQTLTAKVAQLESVAYLGRHALEDTDSDDLLEKATELTAAALDAQCCVVFERNADGADEAFTARASVGCDGSLLQSETRRSTDPDSLTGVTLAAREPVVVENLETDTRFTDETELLDHGIRSAIGVTIGPMAAPWGILSVYDSQPQEFADHDVDFVESAATIIANAIERQRSERRLNDTVDELEASNERLEQFAYATSHDLQEPLRMVSSYLQLLEQRYADDLDSDAEEFIAYAVDGAERMRDMINGLLEYSRIDSQGDPFEAVDLDEVLEDVLTDLHVMIDRHDAEITMESLPTVRGDASQLRQLFQNLLSNAIEYSGDDPPRIRIGATDCDGMWQLSVHDDGIGIAPEDADRVFQVFQRLHSRDEYDGTGIGLALCQRIVERHNGEIWVDSEPGEGSTFSFTLPRTRDAELHS